MCRTFFRDSHWTGIVLFKPAQIRRCDTSHLQKQGQQVPFWRYLLVIPFLLYAISPIQALAQSLVVATHVLWAVPSDGSSYPHYLQFEDPVAAAAADMESYCRWMAIGNGLVAGSCRIESAP